MSTAVIVLLGYSLFILGCVMWHPASISEAAGVPADFFFLIFLFSICGVCNIELSSP